MDGEPLANVILLFNPEEGRPATGQTDEDGNYTLEYVYRVPGCKIGKNTVTFEWPTGYAGPVAIPAKYGPQSELIREVKKGRNTFDFDLVSK